MGCARVREKHRVSLLEKKDWNQLLPDSGVKTSDFLDEDVVKTSRQLRLNKSVSDVLIMMANLRETL